MVTGGQVPGTAQLAATASTSATPDDESNTTSSPVSTSIAVIRRSRSGQLWLGSRCSMTRLRTGSDTVAIPTATAPMFCSFLPSSRAALRHGAQEQLGQRVDVDAGIQLVGCLGELSLVELLERQRAADLGRDRRSGRRAHQDVGAEQRLRGGR